MARQWLQVVFEDGSMFTLEKADGRTRVYRSNGERLTDGPVCGLNSSFRGGSVMVWGSITEDGKTDLIITRGNMTAQEYRNTVYPFY